MSDTAVETINDIITAQGGTSDAKTIVEALEDLGEVIEGGGGGGVFDAFIIAADETAKQVLDGAGIASTIMTPASSAHLVGKANVWLAWLDLASGYFESAPTAIAPNLSEQTMAMYAKGYFSVASGILDADESWTIGSL